MPMEWYGVCLGSQLFLTEAILHGLGVYSNAAFLLSLVAIWRNIFSRVVDPGTGGLVGLLFSPAFLLVFLHAVFTYILSIQCMLFIAILYYDNFRARAMAVLAGLRKRIVPTFFKAVAIVGAYVAVFWPAFRLLDVPGEFDLPLMLLGGAAHLCHATVYRLVVPLLEDASANGVGAMSTRLTLNHAAKICAAALVSVLLDIMSVTVAVRKALPSQRMNTVLLCMVVAVPLVLQQVIYRVWCNKYRPS